MTQVELPRRRRLAPEVRRAQILDEAVTLLSRKGYWGVTLADVAQAAGVTVQGVLHYFPSKTELLLGILDRFDAIAPALERSENAREFVAVMNRLVARNADQPALVQLYIVLSAESLSTEHPAHDYFNRRQTRAITTIEDMADGWHDDPTRFALEVLCVLDGLQLNWLRDRHMDLEKEWNTWLSLTLQGYLVDQ